MRQSVHSDYAMRVLMFLAVAPEQRSTVDTIAYSYRISRHHLNKVVQTLVRADFIATERGRGGGITLKHDPDSITVGAVIRATEGDFAIVECLGNVRYCRINGVCKLREVFVRALEAYLGVLDSVTLGALVKHPDALRGALSVESALPSRLAGEAPAPRGCLRARDAGPRRGEG